MRISKRVVVVTDEQALRKVLDRLMEPERSDIVRLMKVCMATQLVSDRELASAELPEFIVTHAKRRVDEDLGHEVAKYATEMIDRESIIEAM
jgi:hypothetical protein